MGYLKIPNLYKDVRIFDLGMDEVYALEKIHGTSAHIRYSKLNPEILVPQLTFFSGGEKYANFVTLFNQEELFKRFNSFGQDEIIVYGEAYGGKQQGMRNTYGDELKFVAFDVKMNGNWLTVPLAESMVKFLKLEFVSYKRIPCTLEAINTERDADSTQAIRNGMGEGKIREGIVLRPIQECVDEMGERIITKHKRDEFRETHEPRKVRIDRESQQKLQNANKITKEWVTPMRLSHVINKAQSVMNSIVGIDGNKELNVEDTAGIIEMMWADIKEEAKGEIVESPEARKQIARATALLYKQWIVERFTEKVK